MNMETDSARQELPIWEPRTVKAGPWRITNLCDGFFRLDGGSMWGVVPKNIWGKLTTPAPDNTILLALRPFLAQRDGFNVVIEVGVAIAGNQSGGTSTTSCPRSRFKSPWPPAAWRRRT